jgi:hypothetical protein
MTANIHPHKAIIDAWTADTTLEIERYKLHDASWERSSVGEVFHFNGWKFRIKPKMRSVTVDGVNYEFPEPMRVAPEIGEDFYLACMKSTCRRWGGGDEQSFWLKAGFCHLTKEAAEQHRRALLAVNGGVE